MNVVQGAQSAEIVKGVLQLLGVEAEALVEALEALGTGLFHYDRVVGRGHRVDELGLGLGLLADLLGSVLDLSDLGPITQTVRQAEEKMASATFLLQQTACIQPPP